MDYLFSLGKHLFLNTSLAVLIQYSVLVLFSSPLDAFPMISSISVTSIITCVLMTLKSQSSVQMFIPEQLLLDVPEHLKSDRYKCKLYFSALIHTFQPNLLLLPYFPPLWGPAYNQEATLSKCHSSHVLGMSPFHVLAHATDRYCHYLKWVLPISYLESWWSHLLFQVSTPW